MRSYPGAIASLMMAAMAFASATWASPQDEAEVRAIPSTIVSGWNAGKGEVVAGVYVNDGTLVAGDGTVTHGRDTIESYHERLFAGPLKGTKLTVAVTDVRFVKPDIAIMQTKGGILWPGQTELAPGNDGIQSFVVVKDAGMWRVLRFQNTRVLPKQAIQ